MLALSGEGPTIVLEAGFGSSHRVWNPLPSMLSPLGRVVMYDRPGLGRSEACARPRTARVIAEELREGLARGGFKPPYLLIGWSFGGSLVRVFAGMYPGDVAGVVLIDPTAEDFYARAVREHPAVYDSVNAEDEKRAASGPVGELAEEASWDTSMAQVRRSLTGWTRPTILLSSARADLGVLGPLWGDEQRRLADGMPNTRFVPVSGAGHAIHRDQPAAVVTAVQELLHSIPDDGRPH